MQSSTDGMVIEKDDKGNSNTHHHLNTHDDAKLSSSDNEQEIVTLKELLKSGPKFDEEDTKLPSSDSDEEIVTLEELLKNSKHAIQFEQDNYQSTVWQQGEAHQHESQEESNYSPYWRGVPAKPHNVRFREYLRTHGDEYPSIYDEQGPPSPDRPISSLLMELQAEASHGSEVSFATDSFLTPATTTKVKQDNSFNFANI